MYGTKSGHNYSPLWTFFSFWASFFHFLSMKSFVNVTLRMLYPYIYFFCIIIYRNLVNWRKKVKIKIHRFWAWNKPDVHLDILKKVIQISSRLSLALKRQMSVNTKKCSSIYTNKSRLKVNLVVRTNQNKHQNYSLSILLRVAVVFHALNGF